MIDVEKLYPHPDNPRREVGDISELAESIRTNGVYQNLTVIPGGAGVPEEADGLEAYTVVIGHRRLAAAKSAGVRELPCSVVEMDEREQVATMLLENMQRSDLTVYEQAKGFQMMLDLGETQESIARKTGFSKSTVRHRIKLLELDPEEFRKSQKRQPTLTDYIALEGLSDPELKSKALAAIGTDNFSWTLESCKRRQREKHLTEEWLSYIDNLFARVDFDRGRKIVKTLMFNRKITDEDKAILDKLEEDDEDLELDYCYTEGDTHAYILGARREEKLPTYEEEQAARQARVGRVREMQAQAAELRKRFVRDHVPGPKDLSRIILGLIAFAPDFNDVNWNELAELMGLPPAEGEESYYEAEELAGRKDFAELIAKHPERILLLALSDYIEDEWLRLCDWNGFYEPNDRLEKWYALLRGLGYPMSDAERRLLSGEHECFENREE
jgi:ParB family chromosome partitioning protein